MEKPIAWKDYNDEQLAELESLCAEYRQFLSAGKTERECTVLTVQMAEAAGYRNLEEISEAGESVKVGEYEESGNPVPYRRRRYSERHEYPRCTY